MSKIKFTREDLVGIEVAICSRIEELQEEIEYVLQESFNPRHNRIDELNRLIEYNRNLLIKVGNFKGNGDIEQ